MAVAATVVVVKTNPFDLLSVKSGENLAKLDQREDKFLGAQPKSMSIQHSADKKNAKLKLTVASICFIHITTRVPIASSIFFSYTFRPMTIVALYSERAQG